MTLGETDSRALIAGVSFASPLLLPRTNLVLRYAQVGQDLAYDAAGVYFYADVGRSYADAGEKVDHGSKELRGPKGNERRGELDSRMGTIGLPAPHRQRVLTSASAVTPLTPQISMFHW